jgi:hypothetical protein
LHVATAANNPYQGKNTKGVSNNSQLKKEKGAKTNAA